MTAMGKTYPMKLLERIVNAFYDWKARRAIKRDQKGATASDVLILALAVLVIMVLVFFVAGRV